MNHQGPSIERAHPQDVAEIAEVLRTSKLPTDAIEQHVADFLVAREDSRIVGCVAMERYGGTAILRSLAVTPDARGKRLGTRLAQALIDRARDQDVETMVLLTETAERFFKRSLGFEVIDRSVVAPAARASWQFTGAVCQSATCMKLQLQQRVSS